MMSIKEEKEIIMKNGLPLNLLEFVKCDSKQETIKKIKRFKECVGKIIHANVKNCLRREVLGNEVNNLYCFPSPKAIKKAETIIKQKQL